MELPDHTVVGARRRKKRARDDDNSLVILDSCGNEVGQQEFEDEEDGSGGELPRAGAVRDPRPDDDDDERHRRRRGHGARRRERSKGALLLWGATALAAHAAFRLWLPSLGADRRMPPPLVPPGRRLRPCGEGILEGYFGGTDYSTLTARRASAGLRGLAADLERVGWHLLHSMEKDQYSYHYRFPGWGSRGGYGDLWRLHRSDGGPTGRVAVGKFSSTVRDQRVASDGRRYLYVAAEANLTVIDARTGAVRARVQMPPSLHRENADAEGTSREGQGRMSPPARRKVVIRNVLLRGDRLLLIVQGYGRELALREGLGAEPVLNAFLETHVRVYGTSELLRSQEGREDGGGDAVEPLFVANLHGAFLGLEALDDGRVYVMTSSSINTETYLYDPLVPWMRENHFERQDGRAIVLNQLARLLKHARKERVVPTFAREFIRQLNMSDAGVPNLVKICQFCTGFYPPQSCRGYKIEESTNPIGNMLLVHALDMTMKYNDNDFDTNNNRPRDSGPWVSSTGMVHGLAAYSTKGEHSDGLATTPRRLLMSHRGGFALTFRYARDIGGNPIAAPESVGYYAEEKGGFDPSRVIDGGGCSGPCKDDLLWVIPGGGREMVLWWIPPIAASPSPSSSLLLRRLARLFCRLISSHPTRTMRIIRSLAPVKEGDHFTALHRFGDDLAYAVASGSRPRRARVSALNLTSATFFHSYVLDKWWWLDRFDVGASASHFITLGPGLAAVGNGSAYEPRDLVSVYDTNPQGNFTLFPPVGGRFLSKGMEPFLHDVQSVHVVTPPTNPTNSIINDTRAGSSRTVLVAIPVWNWTNDGDFSSGRMVSYEGYATFRVNRTHIETHCELGYHYDTSNPYIPKAFHGHAPRDKPLDRHDAAGIGSSSSGPPLARQCIGDDVSCPRESLFPARLRFFGETTSTTGPTTSL